MPQQHNPGRHVQSLTLPQSRHNHRNTSAYIFPTVSTPRTTPPAPGPNAPTQFASAIQDTSPPPHNGSTVPTPRTIPPTPEPATRRALPHLTAGTQRSNIPPQLASAIQDTSPPPHNGPPHHPDASNHSADTGTRPAPGTKKSGSASRTYSFVSNFSVKNRRLHLAQTNALTQHNQSGAYPLINPCSHN